MADTPPAARLHVGTYTEAGGRGLYPVALSADGALRCGEPFAAAENASFAAGYAGRYYIVDEMAGSIGVYSCAGDIWREEHRFDSGGDEPCYLAVDQAGGLLAAANYGSGSVAVWQLDRRGLPIGRPTLRQSSGTGPVADRQEGPHCHCAVFDPDGAALHVADLGADLVHALPLREGVGELQIAVRAPPGTGPRHLLFAPNAVAILLSELGSQLASFEAGRPAWRAIASRSTLPADFTGDSLGGHLALAANGRRIYVSNRGHDSLAVFALDDRGGLELLQHIPSGGSSPRHFVLLEGLALLVVAHEKDGAVTAFRIADDGRLTATGHRTLVPGSCFVLAAAR